VWQIGNHISEEPAASILRIEVTFPALKKEAGGSSKTLVPIFSVMTKIANDQHTETSHSLYIR
jgi:hypothetical protein